MHIVEAILGTHMIERIRHFNLGNGIVLVAQFWCLVVLFWFIFRSIWLLNTDMHRNTGGSNDMAVKKPFPALSILYMLFSTAFIAFLISDMDEIISLFLAGYGKDYVSIFSTQSPESYSGFEISKPHQESLKRISFVLTISLLCILTAFIMNFSKAFSTLNSLELGFLGKKRLLDIFPASAKKTKRLERLFRLIIAAIFIGVEKQLYELKYYDLDYKRIEEVKNTFSTLSIPILILYILLLAWFFICIKPFIKVDTAFNGFKKLTPHQFTAGLAIALLFLFFSEPDTFNMTKWTPQFLVISGLIIVGTILFVRSVVALEYKYYKNVFRKFNHA